MGFAMLLINGDVPNQILCYSCAKGLISSKWKVTAVRSLFLKIFSFGKERTASAAAGRFMFQGRGTLHCVCVCSFKRTWLGGALKAKAAFEALGHSLHNCLAASLGLAAPCWLSGSSSMLCEGNSRVGSFSLKTRSHMAFHISVGGCFCNRAPTSAWSIRHFSKRTLEHIKLTPLSVKLVCRNCTLYIIYLPVIMFPADFLHGWSYCC